VQEESLLSSGTCILHMSDGFSFRKTPEKKRKYREMKEEGYIG